jgi:hypothetical protein
MWHREKEVILKLNWKNHKTGIMESKLFKVNRKDLINGLLIAFLTALLTGIVELLQGGSILDWITIKPVLIAALCAAISYLIRCLGTNSQNQLFAAEPA